MSKRSFFILAGSLLGVIILLFGYILYNYLAARVVWKSGNRSVETNENFIYFSQLDGTGKENESDVDPRIVGVMVDNHPDARPQSGLEVAPVVYEVPVEGGITRFMAVYPAVNLSAEEVGPVRSARPYFLDWLAEYGDALYMHSGGSPEALSAIKERKIFDANEFWWGSFYWRDNIRSAPHNLYTSSENWQKIIIQESSSREDKPWNGWAFSEKISLRDYDQGVREIKIIYNPGYSVRWVWDVSKNGFLRVVSGDDQNSEAEIWAQNVIVQYVSIRSIDEVDRKKITTIGSGEARVLRDGVMMRGNWKKDSLGDRTRFFDIEEQEISLRPGTTWVEVVPKDATVEVTS